MNKLYAIKEKETNNFIKTYYFDRDCTGIITTGGINTGNIMKTTHKGMAETIVKSLTDNFEVVEIEEIVQYKEAE